VYNTVAFMGREVVCKLFPKKENVESLERKMARPTAEESLSSPFRPNGSRIFCRLTDGKSNCADGTDQLR